MIGVRRVLFLAVLTSMGAASARAQGDQAPAGPMANSASPTAFEVSNRSAAGVLGESGKTATAVFSVRNLLASTVRVSPEITPPDGWRLVLGSASFPVGPQAFEIWTIGFQIPAQARAGRYSIPVLARTDDGTSFADSVVVTIGERYQLETAVAERASYVVAGEEYSTRFVVRNRGNTDVTVRLKTTSSGDSRISGSAVVAIPAAGAATVTVTSRVGRAQINGSDVTELTASHAESETEKSASVMVPVIEPAANWLAGVSTVPAVLRLRASRGERSVSPVELVAGGALGGGRQLDVLLRAPGRTAAMSGERDEYRLGLRSETTSLILGDHYTDLSPLTSGGGEGFGASAAMTLGGINLGAYSLRARRPGTRGAEQGATVALSNGAGSIALNLVSRTGAINGAVSSLSAAVPFAGQGKVELEYALGRDSAAYAAAHRVRLSGRVARAAYEFAAQSAERGFAGPQRGGNYGYGSVSLPIGALSGRIYANQYGNQGAGANADVGNRTTSHGVAVESRFGVSLDLFHASRSQDGVGARQRAEIDAARVFVARSAGPLSLLSTVSFGRNAEPTPSGATFFRELSVSPQLNVRGQSVGVSYSFSDGNSAHGNGTPTTNVGLNANLSLPRATKLQLSGSGWRPTTTADQWGIQGQARLGHTLANGGTVTVAAQATGFLGGRTAGRATTHTMYLEYSTPLRLPVGRSRAAGQVRGQVVDQQGRPVEGALVCVGDRASVSNKAGTAYFAGLRPGSHSVVVGSRGADLGSAMGRATVQVDSSSRAAATFKIAVGQGGQVRVKVSNLAADPTILRASAARETEAIPMTDVVVMLTSQRDTMYQTTDDEGQADFGTVDEGAWTVTVLGDLPAFTRWEKSSIDVAIGGGARAEPEFRLVPRERNVRPVASSGGDEVPATATLRFSASGASEGGGRP